MSTTSKLGIAAVVVASVTAYMAYVASMSRWQYFLTVQECVGEASDLVNQPIRVSGKVVAGSLTISTGRQRATFKLSEADHELSVSCSGPLPDNLAEQIDVVVEGRLDQSGHLHGEKVLTRCASKYASQGTLAADMRAATFAERRRQ